MNDDKMTPEILDAVLSRLLRRSRSDRAAIAVGSGLSPTEWTIPSLAKAIIKQFDLKFFVQWDIDFFPVWNTLVEQAEDLVGREKLVDFLNESLSQPKPSELHRLIARIPVSNFIDTTFDRSILRALEEAGREPVVYDWDTMLIGNWQQRTPMKPAVFVALPDLASPPPFIGVYEPTGQYDNLPIQIENMGDMLNNKDLALIGMCGFEAEHVLHLERLCAHCDKICTDETFSNDHYYWSKRGVFVGQFSAEDMVQHLLPGWGAEYTAVDAELLPLMVDMTRKKQWDCFISYFSGDADFVEKLHGDLRTRGVRVWRDATEIAIGDSIVSKIEEGLSDSYTFLIVLSPEALQRQWVREELNAAYGQRTHGDFKILPVLHRDCELPPLLATYRYADFRDSARYHEQLGLVEYAIKEAVKKARRKK